MQSAPVAETWTEALERVYEQNRKRKRGPTSGRALSKELPGNENTNRRTINRVKEKNRASETKAAAFSKALAVPRAQLPAAAKPPTKAEILDLLEELADEAATIEEVTGLLQPLKEAIVFLANDDKAEALRVLSEAEAQP